MLPFFSVTHPQRNKIRTTISKFLFFKSLYIIVLGFSILKFESKIYAVSKCTNAISDFGINQLGEYYFFGSSWLASELVSTEMDI